MKLAVLVSGGGTNLQALIDETGKSLPEEAYEIVLVVADRDCFALERARKAGIRAELVETPKGLSRENARITVSDHILNLIQETEAEAIVLAGFLTILSGSIIREFTQKIINLHPALLPKFGGEGMWGHHVHEAVLAAGESESGCTVHLVDSGCDTGPILLQKRVPILPEDTAKTLAKRIAAHEHSAIVEGTRLLAKHLYKKR